MSNESYFVSNDRLMIDKDCRHIKLVMTNANANNNKFYELDLRDEIQLVCRWGRVGTSGQSKTISGSLDYLYREMCSTARAKFAKGYHPLAIVEAKVDSNAPKHKLMDVAIKQLTFVPKRALKSYGEKEIKVVQDTIKGLVESNRHSIMQASGNRITVDESGLVKTELGVLSLSTVEKAMKLLPELQKAWNAYQNKTSDKTKEQKYIALLNEYLMLIPQTVGKDAGWHKYFFEPNRNNPNPFEKQQNFLENLKESVLLYDQVIAKSVQHSTNEDDTIYFERQLRLVTDSKVLKEINAYYENSKNERHSSSDFVLKNVYEIVLVDNKGKAIPNTSEAFVAKEKELGNTNRYWHGTRRFNVLSILKNGLVIPKSTEGFVTGRMFGDGVYFAKQSTKSLNYSAGYWDGGSKDNNCFMFLADVVMGKPFMAGHQEYIDKIPSSRRKGVYPISGYDSTIATGNRRNMTHGGSISHLSNHEMIVYDLAQINLRYLCEFESPRK